MEILKKSVWAFDPVHSRIRFDTKYMMISTISGWFRELEGTVSTAKDDFSDSEIDLTIYAHSLYTGVEVRDNHLRSADFFETDKYPTITFHSTGIIPDAQGFLIKGILTIKNIQQPIDFKTTYHGSITDQNGNIKAGFEMDAVFDRKDFNITWNQFFDKEGVLISDRVKVHADVQLLRI